MAHHGDEEGPGRSKPALSQTSSCRQQRHTREHAQDGTALGECLAQLRHEGTATSNPSVNLGTVSHHPTRHDDHIGRCSVGLGHTASDKARSLMRGKPGRSWGRHRAAIAAHPAPTQRRRRRGCLQGGDGVDQTKRVNDRLGSAPEATGLPHDLEQQLLVWQQMKVRWHPTNYTKAGTWPKFARCNQRRRRHLPGWPCWVFLSSATDGRRSARGRCSSNRSTSRATR